jgi:DNA polymerase-3 subunit gamma/tau
MMISESEIQLIDEYTKNLDMSDLGLFWQLTIKTIDDLKIVANENLTLEMYIMQLVHLKNLDLKHEESITTYEQTKVFSTNKIENEKLQEGADKNKIISSIKKQMKNTDQIKENIIKSPELKKTNTDKFQIKSFNDIIQLANKEKEVELKYDLERNVKLVSFNKGKIDISFNEKLNKNFIKILTEKLLIWTGERWVISLSKTKGDKTVYEKNLEAKSNNLIKTQNSEVAKSFFSTFPDAKLIEVKEEEDDA